MTHTRPHTPQNRSMPTPGFETIFVPSGLTVPIPANFHAPGPPVGAASYHQISACCPGSSP